jgi:hypothetical protein
VYYMCIQIPDVRAHCSYIQATPGCVQQPCDAVPNAKAWRTRTAALSRGSTSELSAPHRCANEQRSSGARGEPSALQHVAVHSEGKGFLLYA